jgi:membrane peptidoglycan carboxypeptidase
MQYAMLRVTAEGTGTQADPKDGVQHITKTGTSDNSADTWALGASSSVSLAVWVGSIKAQDSGSRVNLESIDFASGWAPDARHRIWKPLMTEIDSLYGGSDFAAADPATIAAPQVVVPDLAGRSSDSATRTLTDAGFTVGSITQVDSTQPQGAVAGTVPAAGTTVDKGSVVGVTLSTGTPPPATSPPAASAPPTG